MTARVRSVAAIAAALALATGVAACGSDDEETTSASEETTEAASAEEVSLTTGDVEGGYSWEIDPTPTAETKTITYTNDSEVPHALIFARINEGYTLEEAYELQGEKGSATTVAEGDVKPGKTTEIAVEGDIEPGSYAMLCPIPGHYQQGQLEEFDIE